MPTLILTLGAGAIAFVFVNQEGLAGLNRQVLERATGPANLDFGGKGLSEPKEQAVVVIGKVATARAHRLDLPQSTGGDAHQSPEGIAIASVANQLQPEPVVTLRSIVSEQNSRLIVAGDQHVHVAVIIEVTEGGAPGDLLA